MKKRTITLLPTLVLMFSTSGGASVVTSFGINGNCAGRGGVYRVCRAHNLSWLATFGVIP